MLKYVTYRRYRIMSIHTGKRQAHVRLRRFSDCKFTVMILSFRTNRSGQTVQTQIRLLLEEQSDQGLHCLLFHLHLFEKIP